MKELVSSVSPKGQITIPVEIRKLLGVKPKDKVVFKVEEGEGVKIAPLGSRLETSFKAVPPLKQPLTLREMSDIAGGEQAQEAAREGL
ncbi:MAG: AbrB/MazE/SpoVT family DNA-binding domain-containing protein [Chloroflexi bacterium]|nr:AbrB/MazE/SpoVT family DNA-binding domain-containing protein [Chloroflexota bacterium]